MIAEAAALVRDQGWLAAPGVVFPNILRDAAVSTTLAHLMWVSPIPWQELSSVVIGGDLTVHWLTAVPISGRERQLLLEKGYFRLEGLLEQHGVDLGDLTRRSIV
jgi:hypothetical protein